MIGDNSFDIAGVIGFVDYEEKKICTLLSYFQPTQISQCKTLLPTYDVFDEDSNLKPAKEEEIAPVSIVISERKLKLCACAEG